MRSLAMSNKVKVLFKSLRMKSLSGMPIRSYAEEMKSWQRSMHFC